MNGSTLFALRVARRLIPALWLSLAGIVWAQPPAALFYADWTVSPGSVYWLGSGGERQFFTADSGRIYNVAVGPDGLIYFSDSNDRDLKRWTGEEVLTVHTHTTYLRDVAFDPSGRLYFSESSGAGGDGKIFRLSDSGASSLYHNVQLNQVDGYWAGHFAFSPNGVLHLSTGNRYNGRIYQVDESGATTAIHSGSDIIAGLDFDAQGKLYYADWSERIYRLDPGGPVVALQAPGRRISDVSVIKRSVSFGPTRGRVNSIAFDPGNDDILYAGTSSGGVFRSFNAGKSWHWRSAGLANPRIGDVVVYPPNANVVLAATPSGVFRSANQGLTWSQTLAATQSQPPPTLNFLLRSLHRSPLRYDPRDSTIYAAPYLAGLFESKDAGLSWSQIYGANASNPLDRVVTSIDVSSSGGGRIYIATPRGLKERVAGSVNWNDIGTAFSPSEPIAVRVAPSNQDRIYVLAQDIDNWPSGAGLWRRDTATGAFQPTTSNPPWISWYSMMSLGVDPSHQDKLFLGSVELYYSSSGGANFYSLSYLSSAIVGADHHGLTFNSSGQRFYSGHDHGVYFYDVATNDPVAREAALVNTQLYDLEVGSAGTLYIGTQDTGAYRKAAVGDWEDVNVGGSEDVLDILVDPTDDQHIFVRVNDGIVRRSLDGGRNFDDSNSVPAARFWNHQMGYHAASKTLYTASGNKGVYKSTDDGVSFAAANTGIADLAVRCLALVPGSDQTVYIGTYNHGVHRTDDGGANWDKLSYPDDYSALAIAIAPNESEVYVGSNNGVFRSDDKGATWSPSNGGLPALKVVSEIIVDEQCPCRVYAGLGAYGNEWLYGGGVYESVDRGASWQRLSADVGATMSVTSIRIDPLDRSRLHIASYGSGVLTLFRNISGGCPCP